LTTGFGSRHGLLLAWVLLDGAVATYLGLYGSNVLSTLMLLAGVVVFGLAAVSGRPQGANLLAPSLGILAVLLVLAAVVPYRAESPPPPAAFRVFPLIGLVALAVAFATQRSLARGQAAWSWALWSVIGAGLAYRVGIVLIDIQLPFDVPLIQDAAGQAMLRLQDPYMTRVYDSGYPYLPISAIAAAVGVLFGDARWASVVGDLVTVLGIVLFARRVGAAPRLGLTLAALAAWWSGGFYVTWQDFTEPIMIGFLVLGAAELAAPRSRSISGGILLGLAAATKQFGLGLLPFLPWRTQTGRRALAAAIVTWLVVVVPFALWHPPEFAEGAFLSHINEPGRAYALNLLNWPGTHVEGPLLVVFALALVFGLVCQRRQGGPIDAWLAGSAGFLLLAFVLNKIAFVNYYMIPMTLILLLILTMEREQVDADPPPGP
jgi:hypothetical protein